MARVYLAELLATGGFRRKCALKVVHPEFARDDKFINLMQREARLGALLEHPNIINTISYGDADGVHFIDLEYVEGKTLAEFLDMMHEKGKSGLDMGFCLQIILPILRGLDYAHSFTDERWEGPPGMVHRDLKPANVMLSNQAVVKIMDFGIAKAKVSRTNLTNIGQVRGTPVYMAPEQVSGKEVDGGSDQFAAASVFYELVTGKRMFAGINLIAVMQQVASADTGEAEELLDKACPGLGEVIGRMWEREPDDRFPNCDAAADALATVLERFLEEPAEQKARRPRTRTAGRTRKQKAGRPRSGMFGLLSAIAGRSGRKGRKRPDSEATRTGKTRKRRRKKGTRRAGSESEPVLESAEDWSEASSALQSLDDSLQEQVSTPAAQEQLSDPSPEAELATQALDLEDMEAGEPEDEAGKTISVMFMDVIFDKEESLGAGDTVDLDNITTLRNQPVVTGDIEPIADQLLARDDSSSEPLAEAASPPSSELNPFEESLAAAALEPATVTSESDVEIEDTLDILGAADINRAIHAHKISDTLDMNPLTRPHGTDPVSDSINITRESEALDVDFLDDQGGEPDESVGGAGTSAAAEGSGKDDFFSGMDGSDSEEDDNDFFTMDLED